MVAAKTSHNTTNVKHRQTFIKLCLKTSGNIGRLDRYGNRLSDIQNTMVVRLRL